MFGLLKLEFINSIKDAKIWQLCLAMIGLTLFLFPTEYAGYAVIDINGYRGVYNAAWMGESLALVSSWLLLLLGFYFVVGDINKARQTGVLSLILSSRLSVTQFLVLKFLSRFLLLSIITICMLITALIQQRLLGESGQWDLMAYLMPSLVLVWPVLALAAAFSLLFEVVPSLSGKACNAAYFGVWSLLCMVNLVGFSAHSAITAQMESALGQSSGLLSGSISIGITPTETIQKTFIWQGADYNLDIFTSVALQLTVAFIVLLSAIVLSNKRYSLLLAHSVATAQTSSGRNVITNGFRRLMDLCLLWPTRKFPVLHAELQVMIAGLSAKQIWGFVAVSCLALFIPQSGLEKMLLPFASILPMFLISHMSNRDNTSGIDSIVQSVCANKTLTLNRWLAAVCVLCLAYCGLVLRFVLDANPVALFHLLAFIAAVPVLALLLARLCATSKAFELVYLVIWFAGPLNKEPAFDLIGVSGTEAAMLNTWSAFAIISVLLFLALSYRKPAQQVHWMWRKLGVN